MNEIQLMSAGIACGAPAMYDHISAANSTVNPSTVHVQNTGLARYFRRKLLQKAMSVFKWKMPETWDESFVLYVLYCWGFFAVVNTDKFGVIPQPCGLKGYNIFYRPTNAVITNPLFNRIYEPQIDVECTLFQLQPDFGGIMDTVNYYADMMALSTETAALNTINSKLSYVFVAGNKAEAESLKKMHDKILSGETSVVIDKELLKQDGTKSWELFEQNVGANYIVGDILNDMRTWENMFNTDCGIPNANTQKKERLITSEVEANTVETQSRCEIWLDQLKKSCEQTRDMFDIDISVDWRVKPETQTAPQKEEKPNE